ncbi:DUF167 domain-containing protein [Candidatus Nomurabacteria bacterium]|uniref:DUF167 domain-containing protein n=1 Tax=Candidatus Dojkabacteria bacterium TaxID=2099670 RepID=A0A955KXY2_9BACT|nr:DUF167 domain-containing protein [Candidatus Dojkabacteria bacterium]MCB9790164.1 DUF167 domain-containing protein [Candidatus Nomurabacteria bacterium]MCB9803316.1 DUF167 domain-containing protein [Candidatus Nomurabacteria bacterium]
MSIRVYPRKKHQKVILKGDKIHIHVRSVPDKSLANKETIQLLAEHFQIPSSNVRIISGTRSRDKLVEISE